MKLWNKISTWWWDGNHPTKTDYTSWGEFLWGRYKSTSHLEDCCVCFCGAPTLHVLKPLRDTKSIPSLLSQKLSPSKAVWKLQAIKSSTRDSECQTIKLPSLNKAFSPSTVTALKSNVLSVNQWDSCWWTVGAAMRCPNNWRCFFSDSSEDNDMWCLFKCVTNKKTCGFNLLRASLYAFHCCSFIFQIINHDFLWHPPCFPYPKDPSTSNVPARWICHSDHISLVTKLQRTRQKWIEMMIFSCVFIKIESDGLLKGRDSYFESHNLKRDFLFVIVI